MRLWFKTTDDLMEGPPDVVFGPPSIPEVWVSHVIAHQLKITPWAALLRTYPPPPPLPWHKRWRKRIRYFIEDDRERLALLIAPWLDRGSDW